MIDFVLHNKWSQRCKGSLSANNSGGHGPSTSRPYRSYSTVWLSKRLPFILCITAWHAFYFLQTRKPPTPIMSRKKTATRSTLYCQSWSIMLIRQTSRLFWNDWNYWGPNSFRLPSAAGAFANWGEELTDWVLTTIWKKSILLLHSFYIDTMLALSLGGRC